MALTKLFVISCYDRSYYKEALYGTWFASSAGPACVYPSITIFEEFNSMTVIT